MDRILFTDGDQPDESDFQTAFHHSAITDYWTSSGSAAYNSSDPSLNTPALTAYIQGFAVEVDARTGLSLTSSATNYVYLRIDPDGPGSGDPATDDDVEYVVNTSQTPPSDPSLLMFVADTSSGAVSARNDASSGGGSGSRELPWVMVYKRDGTWYAMGESGTEVDSGADANTVLESAVDNSANVALGSSFAEAAGDRITSTITPGSTLIDGNYHYIEGDADPLFDFSSNARGLHNISLEGRSSGGGKSSNDLVHFEESGQRGIPLLSNVTLGFTFGWAAVFRGIQQTSMYNVHADRCGDTGGGGGGLLFTDNSAGTLGSNHFQAYGLQFHGDSMGGPLIRSATQNGNNIALNGMKLVGLDAENGNQSGTGGDSAHLSFADAQRLKLGHIYLRGLDPVDYAIDFDFSNGENVLDNCEIRWDNDVSSGASIRKYRGADLFIRNSHIHRAGGGTNAITGDLQSANLRVSNTIIDGNVDTVSNGTGSARFDGGELDDLSVKKTSLTVNGTAVDSTSGNTQESQNIIVGGGGTLPGLSARGTTDSNGQLSIDFEASSILFTDPPKVNVTPEANVAYDISFGTATYNSTQYYTDVTVQFYTDLSGTTAGSGLTGSIDVEARS